MEEKDWKKIFRQQGITARKYMGDDIYSWAVFKNGKPIVTGIGRSEVNYYKRLIASKGE